MLLQKLKDYRKAVKELTKAAKADPKNPQVSLMLAPGVQAAAVVPVRFVNRIAAQVSLHKYGQHGSPIWLLSEGLVLSPLQLHP